MNKVRVSIIIVNFNVEKELIACISSIVKSKPKVSYEIVVVDNDEKGIIKKILREKFPHVLYVKSSGNIGYGAGNNLGAKHASGDYLFFLNPDTLIIDNKLDKLIDFIETGNNVGAVAPLLLDNNGIAYPQGNKNLGVMEGIVSLSFINKIFPKNKISEKYFLSGWNRSGLKEVDVVPGTAFIIKKSIFEQIKGFDEKFFLFFEEFDLCKRIKNLGYKLYINPLTKVMHNWGASTKKSSGIKKIFNKSRFYYFKKHYGLISACLVELFASMNKAQLLMILILAVGTFLRVHDIEKLMPFIGDQGWFYLSAKDMVINGNVPLVGIPSSHPWLHQGPLWTYMLAGTFWLFGFNPLNGAYLTIALGVLSILSIYVVGSQIFSKRIGLISAFLYATSPLVIINDRMPYHTSPIPLFTIFFIFSLYKIIQNKLIYLPVSILLLTILYNFEIATVVLWPTVIGVLVYKLHGNKIILKEILTFRILILSAISFITPLLPILLYDVKNGYPQTLKFIAWIFYRIISFFTYNSQHEFSIEKIIIMFNFLFDNFRKLVFAQSHIVSFFILIALVSWVIYAFFKKEKNNSYNLIFFLFFVPLLLIIFNQTPSDAYLQILFPTSILTLSLFFNRIIRIKNTVIPVLILLAIIVFGNIFFIFENNFAFDRSSRLFGLDNRIKASKEILNMAENKDFNLIGRGLGSQHKSFTMNYEYLTWWLGHPASKSSKKIKYIIQENENGISVFER